MKIELTDTEWMSIIDKTRDGLPVCCANVSSLRDAIIDICREGGFVSDFAMMNLKEKIKWVEEGHSLPPLIHEICRQIRKENP